MRFLFGLLIGYSMRGKEKLLLIVFANLAFIGFTIVPTVALRAVALLALHFDVQHERRSRPVQNRVPVIKGLRYEDAETKLHAAKLNIRLLATRYDLPLQPGLIIDQVPQPGEEVICGYPVGVQSLMQIPLASVRHRDSPRTVLAETQKLLRISGKQINEVVAARCFAAI